MARKTGSHSDITGPRLREAALRLFAQHGYAAVSMRQIAAEVGVQAGAIYNYVDDKQMLLVGLMEGHMEELLAACAEAVPDQGDPRARLEAFTRFHIRFHLTRGEAVFLAYNELRSLEPENFARIEALRKAYEQVLEGILDAGQAAGVFGLRDTRVAAKALIALLTGLSTWYRPGGRLSPEEIEEIYLDLVRGAVGWMREGALA